MTFDEWWTQTAEAFNLKERTAAYCVAEAVARSAWGMGFLEAAFQQHKLDEWRADHDRP